MAEPAQAIWEGGGELCPQDSHPEWRQRWQGPGGSEVQDSGSDEERVNEESGDGGDGHEEQLATATRVQQQVYGHEQCGAGDAQL